MKVGVFGPGALGCLFAARLAHAGIDAVLIDHRPERAKRLRKNGIQIEGQGDPLQIKVDVVTSPPKDLTLQIVVVKAYATESLKLVEHVPLLSLQNGLGNIEVLCRKVGSSHVLAGITSEGATLLDEGHVRHAGRGTTQVGAWTSCPAEETIDALTRAGFDVETTDAPGQAVWEKVAINAGINPITALLDVPNGDLLRIPEARQLMRDLVVEAVKVSATEGYRFERSLVETAEDICQTTSENISSMLQDVRARRRTEIEAISGEILRRAQVAALPCPRTRVVYQLIRSMEQR